MSTAIVILNWNGKEYLDRFLPFLIQHTTQPDVEIIIADNHSTDQSLKMLAEKYPHLRTIVLKKNYGFAEGYNRALAQVKADFYVLLNSDVEVTENWLNPLINYMKEHPQVAACQPKIKSYTDRTKFEHAGAAGGFIDKYGFPFCRGRVIGLAEEDNGQYDTVIDIFWATGACMVVRADIYKKTGGLDAAFFAHMEEIDLCWRLKSRGYKVVCIPESTVFHIGGGTLHVESPYKTYLNFRNNLLMLYKNLPAQLLKKTLSWRFVFDYAAALQLCLTGKFANARSIFKARADFKKMKPDFEEKRKQNILYATSDNKVDILQKSIVLNFFLYGRKTFNKLIE